MMMKYALFKVLKVFMDEPRRDFYLREVAKTAKVGSGTAKLQLDWLQDNGFLKVKRIANLRLFRADYRRRVFSRFKIAFNMAEIERSGLAEHLLKELNSQRIEVISMVLFGPYARGENGRASSMDILIIGKASRAGKPRINLKRAGRLISAELNIQYYTIKSWKEKAGRDRAFYEGIIAGGIALSGKLPMLGGSDNK